jgi:hypothetical protein
LASIPGLHKGLKIPALVSRYDNLIPIRSLAPSGLKIPAQTVATVALTVRRSNHSTRSHPPTFLAVILSVQPVFLLCTLVKHSFFLCRLRERKQYLLAEWTTHGQSAVRAQVSPVHLSVMGICLRIFPKSIQEGVQDMSSLHFLFLGL